MTELYFVRHAHADYSEDEYHRPLSLKGVRDVERVTSFFNDHRIDAIYRVLLGIVMYQSKQWMH